MCTDVHAPPNSPELCAPGEFLNLSCRRENVYDVRNWIRLLPLSRMGRTDSGHVHIPARVNVYECALVPGMLGRIEVTHLHVLGSPAVRLPRCDRREDVETGCSRPATARHGGRREEASAYPAVACVITHRVPQLALAHTGSQMFRYRCVTAGSTRE